jgi:fermentation-respiration switch protein FrsA (DUF1100 family)
MLSVLEIYIALLVIAYFFSDKLIFRPRPSSYNDNPAILKIETADGEEISALYLANPTADYTILHSHGNGEDIGDVHPIMASYYQKGFSVLVYDYRGYGTSEGKPSVSKSYKDADAAYEYLVKELNTPPEQIIAYGRSVGAALAVHTAYKHEVAGLIVESGFATAFRVRTVIPIAPFDKFRNIAKVPHIDCPKLFMHGEHDRVIPAWHGKALFKKASEPKMHLWVEDAGHNNVFVAADDDYWEAIGSFVEMIEARGEVGSQ